MTLATERPFRQFHRLGRARYKLELTLPQDRQAAAKLLWEARRMVRRTSKMPRTGAMISLACAWAVEEAEHADDSDLYRIYDHIAYIMEKQTERGL